MSVSRRDLVGWLVGGLDPDWAEEVAEEVRLSPDLAAAAARAALRLPDGEQVAAGPGRVLGELLAARGIRPAAPVLTVSRALLVEDFDDDTPMQPCLACSATGWIPHPADPRRPRRSHAD